jgi:hypothetical protein
MTGRRVASISINRQLTTSHCRKPQKVVSRSNHCSAWTAKANEGSDALKRQSENNYQTQELAAAARRPFYLLHLRMSVVGP